MKSLEAATKARKRDTVTRSHGYGLRHAARIARAHGPPVYFWRNGKVLAQKP
jgi:hypothetical protein